jgi:hypothetical protein
MELGQDWQTSVRRAKAMADAVARGDDLPLAGAIVAMAAKWQTAAEADARPLDERLRSFLPLAYNTALQTDRRWSAADLFERLNSFLAALFAAKTHPPEDIAAAVRKVAARAFMEETDQRRNETYYFLIVALGAIVVFSAPLLFGWPQILLGVAATDIVLSMMAK